MTVAQTVSAMRRVADALEQAGATSLAQFPDAMLQGEAAVGAAGFLVYLRDCFQESPKDVWPREELLVLLEVCSRDSQMFPGGIARAMWAAED